MNIFGKGKGFRRAISLILCLVTVLTTLHLGALPATADSGNTVTVTVNYVYDSNKAMVAQPYRAEIEKGSAFVKTLDVPTLLNYSIPTDKADGLADNITLKKVDSSYKLDFTLASVNSDITVTLYYVAGSAKYTVKHYYQNLENDSYGEPLVHELEGDIDAYTKAMADSRAGFTCKGVPEYIIAADGTTIVEIYYDRDYYTIVFDLDSGINGPEPIYGKYGTTYDIESIKEPTRLGYKFGGWEPALTGTVDANTTHKAKWIPNRSMADYTIVIWGQNANDDEYSHLGSYEAWGNVGHEITWNESTQINHVHTEECNTCGASEHTHSTACYADVSTASYGYNMPNNPSEGQVYSRYNAKYIYIAGRWYRYTGSTASGSIAPTTCGKIAHTHTTDCFTCGILNTSDKTMSSLHPDSVLWVYEKSDTVTVDASGRSVLNVYFKRREFTLRFRKANSNTDDYGTITARWGANIKSKYEAIVTNAGDSFWSEKTNAGSPWTNYIGVMPKADKIFYLKTDSSQNVSTMEYYGEDLNREYQQIFKVTFHGSGYTITDEDKYEFEGYTYKNSNKNNGESCNGAKFYYKRNSYNLIFYSASNNDPDKSASVLYEKPLGEYDYTPTAKPAHVEDGAIFVGWYKNPECTGERFVLADHKMPANDIPLYAKWVNGLYTVRTFTDSSMSVLYTYDGYDGVQENIEKYTLATEPVSPTPGVGEAFIGWFYLDAGVEKPFSFMMPITRDYDLYPKYAKLESLKYVVHYYKAGTTEKVADDRENIVKTGETVTEKAKMGTDLNLVAPALQNKYFPTQTSTSVIIANQGQEIIFYYTEATNVKYTVYYQDAAGNNLLEPVEKTTDYSIVTEQYVAIPNWAPRQFSIMYELSSVAENNKIIFVYDPTLTALKITKTGAETVDENQAFIFSVVGSDDNTKNVNLTVSVQGNGSVTIDSLPLGSYKVTELADWSWRYEPKDGTERNLVLEAGVNEITFVNERKNDKWLDGDAVAENHFNSGANADGE